MAIETAEPGRGPIAGPPPDAPKWLDFCGRAPNAPYREDEMPRTGRLALSPVLRSLLPMLRDFFTTDQACDCRRHHISDQKCAACFRFCLCPYHCRHCAATVDLQVDTFAQDREIVTEDPATIHDVLYHQIVYNQELPAAMGVKYPCERDQADIADLIPVRKRLSLQLIGTNALKHFNLAALCLGSDCATAEHLVLRSKTGPKSVIPGVSTFLGYSGKSTFEEVHMDGGRDGWVVEFNNCPPELDYQQAVDAANASAVTGCGRANRGCTAEDNFYKPVVEPEDYLAIHRIRIPRIWREVVPQPRYGVPIDQGIADGQQRGIHVMFACLAGTVRGQAVHVEPRPIDWSLATDRRYNNLRRTWHRLPPLVQYHSGSTANPRMMRFLNLIHDSMYYAPARVLPREM